MPTIEQLQQSISGLEQRVKTADSLLQKHVLQINTLTAANQTLQQRLLSAEKNIINPAPLEFQATNFLRGDRQWIKIDTLGEPGDAATISVGSVVTGPPGVDAEVVNVGTSEAAVLNFTIPRGIQGLTGATGSVASASAPIVLDGVTKALSLNINSAQLEIASDALSIKSGVFQPAGSYVTGTPWLSCGFITDISGKQDVLVGIGVGQNIKSINSASILAAGNLDLLKIDQTTPQTITGGAPYFSLGLQTTKIYPHADSATAFGYYQADGTTKLINIHSSSAYANVGTATTGAPRLYFGTKTPSGDDSAICIGRELSGDSLFSHCLRDESTFISTTTGGYASFDSAFKVNGAGAYNHFANFQARSVWNGSGTVSSLIGFDIVPTYTGSGLVGAFYGVHIYDGSGAGTHPTSQYGVYIDALAFGATNNYAIYVAGNNPTYLGGTLQTGGIITCGSTIKATNFWCDSAVNTVAIGVGVPAATGAPYYFVGIGHNAAHNMTASVSFSTIVGASAGYSITTGVRNTLLGAYAGYSIATSGSRNVMIGQSAGRYETASDSFYVNNIDQSTSAQDKAYSLLYGKFSGSAASLTGQYLRINGSLGINTTPNASAILDIVSTTQGVLFPRMTTTQKAAIVTPAEGLMVWDTTLHVLSVYNGTAWQSVTAI